MKRLFFNLLLVAMLVCVGDAVAWTEIDGNTIMAKFSWTEPSQNTDNSSLTDLSHVKVFRRSSTLQPDVEILMEPATTPNGGGSVSIYAPVAVAKGEAVIADFYMVAYASSGNSGYSLTFSLPVDRTGGAPPPENTTPKTITGFLAE